MIQRIQRNVDFQVNVSLKKYDREVAKGDLAVVGAIYDFQNEFKRGFGRLIFVNINGEKDIEKMKKLSITEHLNDEFKNVHFDRR